jgi:hypothetical protein
VAELSTTVGTDAGGGEVNVTDTLAPDDCPFTANERSAAPGVFDVTVVEYVPSRLSITAATTPTELETVTSSPPRLTGLPFASRRVTVIVDVAAPSAGTDAGAAAIVDCAALAGPAVNDTVTVFGEDTPLTSKETVAVPAIVGATSDAEYVPSLLSVTVPTVPTLACTITASPPRPNGLPFASRRVTVIVDVAAPSAEITDGAAIIVDADAEATGAMVTFVMLLGG